MVVSPCDATEDCEAPAPLSSAAADAVVEPLSHIVCLPLRARAIRATSARAGSREGQSS